MLAVQVESDRALAVTTRQGGEKFWYSNFSSFYLFILDVLVALGSLNIVCLLLKSRFFLWKKFHDLFF